MIECWNDLYSCIKGWQTLISALIALAAAYVTIRTMRNATKLEIERNKNSQRRKLMAARAEMPDALSEMSTYTQDVAEYLMKPEMELPDAPDISVASLKRIIEFIDDYEAEQVFKLMSFYQVHRARLQANKPRPRPSELDDRFYDLVLLRAYINSLFDYARNERVAKIYSEPTKAEMQDAFTNVISLKLRISTEGKFLKLNEMINNLHP